MKNWQEKKLSELLTQRKRQITIDPKTEYALVTISKKGIVKLRGKTKGASISAQKAYITKAGDFIYSRLSVHTGAFGIVPPELNNALITGEMPCFEIDESQIQPKILTDLIGSPNFLWQLTQLTKGMGRVRIKESMMLSLSLVLPNISEQNKLSNKISLVKTNHSKLDAEITHQQTLLKKLRQQILQEAIEGKLTADWRTKNSSPAKGRCPKGAEGSGPEGLNPHQGRSPSGAMVKSKLTFTLPHLTTFRKSLRKNLTPAEAKLWTLLKGKQLQGRKFRRQHSVANYILDFYCPAEKLAIELDGEGHNNPQVAEHDEERGIFLKHTGVKVLRFENKAVFESPEGVLAMIEQAFNSSGPDLSDPNPSAPSGHLPLAGEEFESAGELLERIRVEKERLVKVGEIKKQKPLPPIKDEEKPFELPMGWEWCRLESVSNAIHYGATKSAKPTKTGVRLLRITDIQNNAVNWNNVPGCDYSENDVKNYGLSENDILIARTGGTIGKTYLVKSISVQSLFASYLIRIIPNMHINAEYLKLFLESPFYWKQLHDAAWGAGQPNVNGTSLKKLCVPLPTLSEQKSIVACVNTLLTFCDQLKTQISQNQTYAKALMQAVLKEAFF